MLHSGIFDGTVETSKIGSGCCFKGLQTSFWFVSRFPTAIYSTHFNFLCQFSLLGFDILQAIGGILNIRWAHIGIVSTGPYCIAQGAVSQFGELGVAVITLVRIFSLCPCARDQLMHILPDSRHLHIHSDDVTKFVALEIGITRPCTWAGHPHIHFFCALDWHRRWHSRPL
jgi:hypothetical protein